MAGFKDILPLLGGAALGLTSPNVGPALAQGVSMWHASKREQERQADRADYKKRQAERDAAFREQQEWNKIARERSNISWEQGQEDRTRRIAEAERNLEWTDLSRARTQEDWEYQDEQRAIAEQERERTHGRQDVADARAAARQAAFEKGVAEDEQAKVSWQQAYEALKEDPNAQAWMNSPGMQSWVQGAIDAGRPDVVVEEWRRMNTPAKRSAPTVGQQYQLSASMEAERSEKTQKLTEIETELALHENDLVTDEAGNQAYIVEGNDELTRDLGNMQKEAERLRARLDEIESYRQQAFPPPQVGMPTVSGDTGTVDVQGDQWVSGKIQPGMEKAHDMALRYSPEKGKQVVGGP